MTLQDRAFAIGIFLIMGICCIGAYVAVSGFVNANPTGLALSPVGATSTSRAPATIVVPTGTVEIPTLDLQASETAGPPTNTPKGFKATLTPLSRGTPSPAFLADIPTATPITPASGPTVAASTPTPSAGCGYAYCPRPGGPPDDRAPTGNKCPRTYLWGFVLSADGKGQPGIRIQYTSPDGGSDRTFTKGPPDPPGRWDVSAAGGTWIIQVMDQNGRPTSPAFAIQGGRSDPSGASCPTRLDFVQQ